MSCTVSELPTGCRLRSMSSTSQNTNGGSGNTGGGGINVERSSALTTLNTGGIHIGGLLSTTNSAVTTTGNEMLARTGDLQQRSTSSQSQKPCCFCWCCCCSCSWWVFQNHKLSNKINSYKQNKSNKKKRD